MDVIATKNKYMLQYTGSQMKRAAKSDRRKPRGRSRQLAAIVEEIAALGYICSGTVVHKTKKCGRSSCACSRDESARHGPYFEWHRSDAGHQVHSMLPSDIGPLFEKAAANYQKLRVLLREWERQSALEMIAMSEHKSQKRRHLHQRPSVHKRGKKR